MNKQAYFNSWFSLSFCSFTLDSASGTEKGICMLLLRKSILPTLLSGCLLAALVAPCAAQTFRVVATGTLYDIYDPAGRYDSSVVAGTPFRISYQFNYKAAPVVATPAITYFNLNGASHGATVCYGDYRIRPSKNSFNQVTIVNDGLFGIYDDLTVQDYWSMLSAEGIVTSSNKHAPRLYHGDAAIEFYDPTATAFSTMDLNQLQTVQFSQFGNTGIFTSDVSWEDGDNPSDVIGQIETLTISPVHDGDRDDDDGSVS